MEEVCEALYPKDKENDAIISLRLCVGAFFLLLGGLRGGNLGKQ